MMLTSGVGKSNALDKRVLGLSYLKYYERVSERSVP